MILIIPNIVQNLYLHLSMPLFLVYIHHTPHHQPTQNLATPTSPTPTPDRTPPPYPDQPPPPPPTQKNFFFEFSQKLYFSVHIHPDPPTRPPSDPIQPPPPPPKKKKKKKKKLNFHKSFNSPFPSILTSPNPTPPTRPPPPPTQKKKKYFFFFEFSQKLHHFSIHIHSDPPQPNPPPPRPDPPPLQFFFFLIFTQASLLCSYPP